MCCNSMCKHCGKFPAEHNDRLCKEQRYEALADKHDECPRAKKSDDPASKPPQRERDEDLVLV